MNYPKKYSMSNNEEKLEITYFDKYFRGILVFFFLLIIGICCLPFFFTNYLLSDKLDFSTTGEIGDTLGGIMGPFVAILAAILTFLAFWAQFKANQLQINIFAKQKEQFDKQLEEQKIQFNLQLQSQKNTEKLERFENKYYELVRFHRSNMAEIKIEDKIFSRECFIQMYSEFKYCYDISSKCLKSFSFKDQISKTDLTIFSYKICFLGLSVFFEEQNQLSEIEKKLFETVKVHLEELHKNCKLQEFQSTMHKHIYPYKIGLVIAKEKMDFIFYYVPFEGHISKLAHYYRHLFHTVKFVVNQNEDFISFNEKLDYLQTLRAQLSNHEQVMLYYNAVSGLGRAWFDNNYFTNYKMIHNIPLNLTNLGLIPHDHPKIKEGITFWENKNSTLFEQDE